MKYALLAALVVLALPRAAHAKGCTERSAVVGYQRCSHFGTWSRNARGPAVSMATGLYWHQYNTRPFTLHNPQPTALAMDSHVDGTATTALGGAMRILLGSDALYGGLEMDGGGLLDDPHVTGLPTTGSQFEALAIAGAHLSLWRFAFGAEVAAGGRITTFAFCPVAKGCELTETQGRRELELRIEGQIFFTPQFSVGIRYGKSVLDHDDRSFLVSLGIHFKAMDGMP